MKLLPSSLAARTVLLVIAIVAVAEWVTFSLVLKKGDVAHMRQTTQFVVGQIRLMQTVLPGLADEARRCQDRGVELRLVSREPVVTRIVDACGLSGVLPIYPTARPCRSIRRASASPAISPNGSATSSTSR